MSLMGWLELEFLSDVEEVRQCMWSRSVAAVWSLQCFGFLRWILFRLPSSHWIAVKGGGHEWGKWAAYMIQGFHEKFAPSFSSDLLSHATDIHLFLCISLVSTWSSCCYVCCAFGEEKMCWVVSENPIFCFSHHFLVWVMTLFFLFFFNMPMYFL